MNKLELDNIITQVKNLKNSPNDTLVNSLNLLSEEFDKTKNNILELTYHLDKIEELYNIMIKEIESRR
jgi:hypothetical protein